MPGYCFAQPRLSAVGPSPQDPPPPVLHTSDGGGLSSSRPHRRGGPWWRPERWGARQRPVSQSTHGNWIGACAGPAVAHAAPGSGGYGTSSRWARPEAQPWTGWCGGCAAPGRGNAAWVVVLVAGRCAALTRRLQRAELHGHGSCSDSTTTTTTSCSCRVAGCACCGRDCCSALGKDKRCVDGGLTGSPGGAGCSAGLATSGTAGDRPSTCRCGQSTEDWPVARRLAGSHIILVGNHAYTLPCSLLSHMHRS